MNFDWRAHVFFGLIKPFPGISLEYIVGGLESPIKVMISAELPAGTELCAGHLEVVRGYLVLHEAVDEGADSLL